MKLIYGDKYDIVDKNMSDSNVGARKNIRNHIFIINEIINKALECRDHGTSNINEFNIHHASPSYFHHPGGAETW